MSLFEILKKTADKRGFPLSGALDLDSVLSAEFQDHVRRYDSWIENGNEGEMAYLRRGRDRRADPRRLFASAQSIFCVAVPYWRQPLGGSDTETGGPRYARYLKGRDYHQKIAEDLEELMMEVRGIWDRDLNWKICVDTSAVLERSWAALAGLGWIGKNTTLIHPQLGSYLFLGEVLIDTKVERGPSPLPNYCGNCTRCLDACPTSAFTEAGTLDARRCISYWTLEKRGALPISNDQKRKIGTWVAGCDICQEVCPFNVKASREALPELPEKDATLLKSWLDLLAESPEAYARRVQLSALDRVKPAQFSRNLAITVKNFLDSSTPTAPELARLREAVEKKIRSESDPVAQAEWQKIVD